MEQTLEYLVYGKPPIANGVETPLDVLAVSAGLPATQGKLFHQLVPVDPTPDGNPTYAIMRLEAEFFLLAQAQEQNRQTRFTYLRLPTASLQALNGDLNPLIQVFQQPLNVEQGLPMPITWTEESRSNAIQIALDMVEGDMSRLLLLLGGALFTDGLWLSGFIGDTIQRLRLLQGLTLMIPSPFRHYLTFSTYALRLPANRPRIIISESAAPTTRYPIQWGKWEAPTDRTLAEGSAYLDHLRHLWQGDISAFVAQLSVLDSIALVGAISDTALAKCVDTVAIRHRIDLALDESRPVTIDDLMNNLVGDTPPQGDIFDRYAEALLRLTLEQRHPEASLWVAKAMDNSPALDTKLAKVLDTVLEGQPDTVYAFVRTRLNEGVDARWLTRLHKAAEHSLNVALASKDPATVSSWLQLLSREPLRYELSDILREGMAQALPMSYGQTALTRDLLVISVKREPSFLVGWLEDKAFYQSLPDDIQAILFEGNATELSNTASQSRELFLLGVERAIHQEKPLTQDHLEQLWDIITNKPNLIIAEPYRAQTLLRLLIEGGRASLPEEGLESLLTRFLANGDDEFFYSVAATLATQDALLPVLAPVLYASERIDDDLLMLIGSMTTQGTLTPQNGANVYVGILEARGWEERTSLSLSEQVARILAQHTDVKLTEPVLWRLLELFDDQKHETLAKTTLKRLLSDFSLQENEAELVKSLLRLRKAIQIHAILKPLMMGWWRDYTHSQTNAQLQKLERALEGNRTIDDLRAIVTTTHSVRRLFGNKTLEEWAQDISTAFRVMALLSDGFDGEKLLIDMPTVRAEMGNALDTLPPDVRQVLATNLKQLAQLLADMADRRTKPSLMKSDEALERQLASGDIAPQSAVDLMKWLSGFLDGTQK